MQINGDIIVSGTNKTFTQLNNDINTLFARDVYTDDEEQEIGTFNGKTLYQKVLSGNLSNEEKTTIKIDGFPLKVEGFLIINNVNIVWFPEHTEAAHPENRLDIYGVVGTSSSNDLIIRVATGFYGAKYTMLVYYYR